MQIGNNIT